MPSKVATHTHLAEKPPRFEFVTVTTRSLSLALQMDPFPKLLTACAPPGYGKTVLLTMLYDQLCARGFTCVWLTMDDRDRDILSLMQRIAAAIRHAGIQASPSSDPALPHFPRSTSTVDAITHELTSVQSSTVVFIDNLGFCQDPMLESVLQRLVFHSSPELHLVLSSTQEIPVDMSRAKLECNALELRAKHLSFDSECTQTLMSQAGVHLAQPELLSQIVAQTEGWPAAIRLLQVLLRGGIENTSPLDAPDLHQILHRFGGDHEDIAHFLTRRVLVNSSPDLARFMSQIALVREFNADLAAAMTESPEAAQWIEQLVASNALIFPLDRSRRWFRFHTLMREFLLAEGAEKLPSAHRKQVLARAAHWHEQHGDTSNAISLALEAGEVTFAQSLLERTAHDVVGNQGHMAQLIGWVDSLLAAGIQPSPEVNTWFVWALCDSLQYERALIALDALDKRASTDAAFLSVNEWDQHRMLFARILANIWLDRTRMASKQAQEWLAKDHLHDALSLAAVLSSSAIGIIDWGNLAEAHLLMTQASAVIPRAQSAYGTAWVAIIKACIEIETANPAAADILLQTTRNQVAREIGTHASILATLDFVHARALLDQGRTEAARKLASSSLHRAAHHGLVLTLEHGLIASVAFWNEPDSANDSINSDTLDHVANSYPGRGRGLLCAAKIRKLLQQGRWNDASALATMQVSANTSPSAHQRAPMQERGEWMLAQLELTLTQRTNTQSIQSIDTLIDKSREFGRQRDVIELLLIKSEVIQRAGDHRAAQRQLELAITLAAPGNLIQPFLSKSRLLAALRLVTESKSFNLRSSKELALLERLRVASCERTESETDVPHEITETPSPREIELLNLLNEGFNNEQVAQQLHLSISTVKWHLHNLYVKLGVRNRSAALARARSLQLLARRG